MGSSDCQFALHGYAAKNKTALCILANPNNSAANADVLHRFHRVYGKSKPWLANHIRSIRQFTP
jgi:hypothetical protein